MTRLADKLVRALVDDWGKMLDERTETFNLIIPKEIEDSIDILVAEVKRESLEASERAKKATVRLQANGQTIGRSKIVTPSPEELKRMLVGRSIKAVAKELKISRSTLRKRLNG